MSEDLSDSSDQLLPPHGGYRTLRSFHVAEVVFDATLIFCDRFIEKRSRTHDQMVQAARSGKQNIVEGSVASGTSKKTELKLTNVARASLEELMRDYHDFLRGRGLRLWPKDSPEALAARKHYKTDQSDVSVLSVIKTAPPEPAANILLCSVNQASYLLGRELKRLEQDFLKHGGFTERLYATRTRIRTLSPSQSNSSESPSRPRCGKPMRQRVAQKGPHPGERFWAVRVILPAKALVLCRSRQTRQTCPDKSDQ